MAQVSPKHCQDLSDIVKHGYRIQPDNLLAYCVPNIFKIPCPFLENSEDPDQLGPH